MFLQLSNFPLITRSPIGIASSQSVKEFLAFSKPLKFENQPAMVGNSRSTSTVFMTRNPDLVSYCDNSYAEEKGRLLYLSCTFPSTDNQEQCFPLLGLPRAIRNNIYRHALSHALPRTILLVLPMWMDGVQGLVANSITKLQLSCRQLYHEFLVSSTRIANFHSLFLHATLISWTHVLMLWHPTLDIRDKSYTYSMTNIVLKANWDGYDWAAIRDFSWSNWKNVTLMVCGAFLRFFSLRRITLDWRVPHQCGFLKPTGQQRSLISPYFSTCKRICLVYS